MPPKLITAASHGLILHRVQSVSRPWVCNPLQCISKVPPQALTAAARHTPSPIRTSNVSLIKSISCWNLKAIWNTEITIRGQEGGFFFFLALAMKEADKGLRTFYQTSFRERRAPAGSRELETRRDEMIRGGDRAWWGGQRLGAQCCYHRLPAPTGTLLRLYPVQTLRVLLPSCSWEGHTHYPHAG